MCILELGTNCTNCTMFISKTNVAKNRDYHLHTLTA